MTFPGYDKPMARRVNLFDKFFFEEFNGKSWKGIDSIPETFISLKESLQHEYHWRYCFKNGVLKYLFRKARFGENEIF